ncbi:MAG: DUF1028 domain-containing protein [Bacteroidota bacterium]
MKRHAFLTIALLAMSAIPIHSQNLPSLLADKNINATFSIVAYDENTEEWGIAVATNNIYVGNSTIYIRPGLGAFSVIAETEPNYALQGFEKLKQGKTIETALLEVKRNDPGAHYRQVAGIDAKGNGHAFTGEALKYWKGEAQARLGHHFVVMGNQLAQGVLEAMATAYENSKGSLAERLLHSLTAGQQAGGQISGKQSAAVVVKGTNNAWYDQIDLRVDHSQTPLKDLRQLMDYHYGRIRLNQALYAQRAGNLQRAIQKLGEAAPMLEGWTGMYPKIARAHIIMGNENAAVTWIQKGLAENPNWEVYLPAFYVLKDHPEMKSIIRSDSFTIRDWESAMGLLGNLGREPDVIALGEALLQKGVESSYLIFLLARSLYRENEMDKALAHLKKALQLDAQNVEAQQLLAKIKA